MAEEKGRWNADTWTDGRWPTETIPRELLEQMPQQRGAIMGAGHAMTQSKDEPNLAHEVAELRKEIAALRAELAPVPSLIVTGRQALDEFKRLAHAGL